MTPEKLIDVAKKVRLNAHCPYSHYQVGAALLGKDGQVFSGCNVENASYGLTICAERNAATTAVGAGVRKFSALAVVTKDGASMCGACRQFLVEFGKELKVYLASESGAYRTTTLEELLPGSFGSENLT